MPGEKELTGNILKIALKMLEKTTSILEKNNIKYVIDYGTLLGIVRENRLLPWDSDMDISIPEEDLKKLLKIRRKLWFSGYRTAIQKFKMNVGPFKKGEIRLIRIQTRKFIFFKGLDLMDIFIKRRINDAYFYIVGVYNCVLKSSPAKYLDNIDKLIFNDKEYSVPANYKEYLSFVYGEWQTPVKENWDYKNSDNCFVQEYSFIRPKGNLFKKAWGKLRGKLI